MHPNTQGTLNLQNYFSPTRPLNLFTICSSISGIFRYPGQSQYAAANTFQDMLARHRRSKGFKSVAIDLGITRDVGILAEQGTTGKLPDWEAILGIRDKPFHALIKSLINREWIFARATLAGLHRSKDDR